MLWLARIFLLVDLHTLLLKFSGKKKKNSFLKLFFYFFPPTLNIIYFDKKEIIYFWGSVCVFSRMPLLKVIVLCRKIMKYLKI